MLGVLGFERKRETNMKLKIKELVKKLDENRSLIVKNQGIIISGLTIKERQRSSRNKSPNGGWVVPGISRYTQAIKKSRLPYDKFWSGSNPTPSTQYPKAIYDFLRDVEAEGV